MTDDLPVKHFAPCELDDERPFPSWQPSPEQIQRWCVQIRREAGCARDGEEATAQESGIRQAAPPGGFESFPAV